MAGRSRVAACPQRTCVGCRARTDMVDLLRVVAVGDVCVPDPERRRPGRGAHLHPDRGCLDAAERRRALTRALRHAGPLDTGPLRSYVESQDNDQPERRANERAGRDE